jgi:hypothetical protein
MKDISGQRKIPLTYHSLVLRYPIPGFLILGYLPCWDIPGISQNTQKISLGYPATGHIPDLSKISHRYPKTSRFILGVGIPDVSLKVQDVDGMYPAMAAPQACRCQRARKTVGDSARPSASTVISGARSDIGLDMERISL